MAKQVISVSRRTDIPAFFSDWLMQRLQAGFVMVRNPRNPAHVMRISLAANDVAALVFWSRNYAPLLPFLDEIDERGYRCLFHLTLTNYGPCFEPHVPSTDSVFRHAEALAHRYGPERLIWRYDPIILGSNHQEAFHVDNFCLLAERMQKLSRRCIVSFLDRYACTVRGLNKLSQRTGERFETPSLELRLRVAQALIQQAASRNMDCRACCEADLVPFSVAPSACIDAKLIRQVAQDPLLPLKPAPTRKGCGCIYVRDIGAYQTCAHGCVYCYANESPERGSEGRREVNPQANALGPGDLTESAPLRGHSKQLRLFSDE